MTREIQVHMDTLRYTREGLASRGGIALEVGQHNQVVLVRPKRTRAVRTTGVGFAEGSAFPLCGALMVLWRGQEAGAPFTHHTARDPGWDGSVLQLYGHSTPAEQTDDKALSQRRSRAARALICSDVAAFHALADEDGWGDAQSQSMLRTLGCDPGPVDGTPERLTQTAVRTFAERYNRGVYHRNASPPPTTIPEDGELSRAIHEAIRDAFVCAHGLGTPDDQLHPSHPVHGCCGFNRASDAVPANRRVTVLTYPVTPELSHNAPCTLGDSQACAVVDDHANSCMWFREHVIEASPDTPTLLDPRWLWIGENRYVLSALTTADDDETVHFEVFDSAADDAEPEQLEGVVRGGVAAVVWTSTAPPTESDGRPPDHTQPRFRISHPHHEQAEAFANWPERKTLELIQFTDDLEVAQQWSGGVRVVAQDGSYEHYTPFSEAVPRSPRLVVLSFPDVPTNARVDVIHESGDLRRPILTAAVVETVLGNCEAGEQCEELPPPPAPPDNSLEDIELDESASVGVAEDTRYPPRRDLGDD